MARYWSMIHMSIPRALPLLARKKWIWRLHSPARILSPCIFLLIMIHRESLVARELAMLKPNAILINTSRGALVCEDAMIEALKENRFSGAGLDTLCQEPPRAGNPLLKMDNCVLTDHSGFNTVEAVEDLRKKATQNVIDVLTGASFRSCVNAPILSHVR